MPAPKTIKEPGPVTGERPGALDPAPADAPALDAARPQDDGRGDGDPGEVVELLVRAAERGHVARALIDAARRLGVCTRAVVSTTSGYKAPRAVADAADVALAADLGNDGVPVPGTRVYAAASGRPGWRREGVAPVDPAMVPDPDLPAELGNRGRRRRA